ncbi:MAG: DoxX family protein [Ferruginibacter sp.]
MKKIKAAYWIITVLFAAFMLLSAIPNIFVDAESVAMITGLGYPKYFIPFIGVAKLLGVLVILVPGFKRLKKWAYAGLFFDLTGATYSVIAKEGFQLALTFMILPIGFLFLSYYLWHTKNETPDNAMNTGIAVYK